MEQCWNDSELGKPKHYAEIPSYYQPLRPL